MATNRGNNNLNLYEDDNNIWQIVDNLEENQRLELLHHRRLNLAAGGDMAAPEVAVPVVEPGPGGMVLGGEGGGGMVVVGDWELELHGGDDNYVNDIGDFNHVVATPDVAQLPINQMAHHGGGDAELIFDPQLAVQEFNQPAARDNINLLIPDEIAANDAAIGPDPNHGNGNGIGIGNGTGTGTGALSIAQVVVDIIMMEEFLNQRAALTEVQERSVQEILRLCDHIQRQLAIISAQIECYENKLNEHYASLTALTIATSSSSSLPLEPDGDAI